MCGICGFNWSDPELGRVLSRDLTHRGPDQEGIFTEAGITLGHRRLSIIDLSENGRQPMSNEDESVWLVFNGEIYNFQELTRTKEKGHWFRGYSDSEAIVHAYEEWGPECLSRLRGMFALALWDRSKQQLLVARDRIGIKPLYYYRGNGRIAFASEIKSLLRIPAVDREVNLQALDHYLGYEFVPSPWTMFTGVYKLPPGHYFLAKNGELEVHRYWDLEFRVTARTPAEAVAEMRELLKDTVRLHLISDVPLGVFLSGGLDSSTWWP